ncbi:MAG: phosphoribosylformylglycinamidine synthase subunit PurQ [Actinobacteria bacterium]|nr:MAG: phosphoribosylformylglycinamidine synthase subunit PurQ [Actinomycetota bacterium]
MSASPGVAIVVFPGSNDDRDAAWALGALGADPVLVWHGEPELPAVGAVVLPGGFSYGDYLRCGAIARFSPVIQILCEAGLLPGALRANASLSFICRDVRVVVERSDTLFTSRCDDRQELVIPVKHGEGCWFAGVELGELESAGQIVLRYAPGDNPNGSLANVAGVVNDAGNVMGLMPHPEHAVDPLLGSGDGGLILASLVDAARDRVLTGVA